MMKPLFPRLQHTELNMIDDTLGCFLWLLLYNAINYYIHIGLSLGIV